MKHLQPFHLKQVQLYILHNHISLFLFDIKALHTVNLFLYKLPHFYLILMDDKYYLHWQFQ